MFARMTEDKITSSELQGDAGSGAAHASDSSTRSSEQSTDPTSPTQRERRGPPPNPLYHPLFLPVLLVGFTLWFFWDGFLTTDPEMQKHQLFNRVFFGITLLFCLRIVPRGIREYREERDAAADVAEKER
jgi:hypothetical protein